MTQDYDDIAHNEIQKCIELLNEVEKRMNNAWQHARMDPDIRRQCEYALDDTRSDLEGAWLRYEDEHLRTAAE